ncbi:MAG: cyclase family protein [bacterium]
MKIIDISLSLENGMPVYPNNIPLSVSIHQAMPPSATQLSSITIGSHTGTHIDAPGHAIVGSPMLAKVPLETFIGPARVLDFSLITKAGDSVTLDMIKEKNIQKSERVLLKTYNSIRGLDQFYEDYVYLSGDAADYLADVGVVLVGIDALSIKQRGSTDHRPHTSLLSKNIPVIEGLKLTDISEGEYELYCLPLNFIGIDGSPARAILIDRN